MKGGTFWIINSYLKWLVASCHMAQILENSPYSLSWSRFPLLLCVSRRTLATVSSNDLLTALSLITPLSLKHSLSLSRPLFLFLFCFFSKIAKVQLSWDQRRLGTHTPAGMNQTLQNRGEETLHLPKCHHRRRSIVRMRNAAKQRWNVVSGHSHHRFWALTDSSQLPRHNGTLRLRRKCPDCWHIFPRKMPKLCLLMQAKWSLILR